jgi:hypothetical protein
MAAESHVAVVVATYGGDLAVLWWCCPCPFAGKKEKVTAEMKRAARKQREAEREEKAAKGRKDREEIFEVCLQETSIMGCGLPCHHDGCWLFFLSILCLDENL